MTSLIASSSSSESAPKSCSLSSACSASSTCIVLAVSMHCRTLVVHAAIQGRRGQETWWNSITFETISGASSFSSTSAIVQSATASFTKDAFRSDDYVRMAAAGARTSQWAIADNDYASSWLNERMREHGNPSQCACACTCKHSAAFLGLCNLQASLFRPLKLLPPWSEVKSQSRNERTWLQGRYVMICGL